MNSGTWSLVIVLVAPGTDLTEAAGEGRQTDTQTPGITVFIIYS